MPRDLADVILSREGEDEEAMFEDEELERELAQLRAHRLTKTVGAVPAANALTITSLETHGEITEASLLASNRNGDTRRARARSLADAILNSACADEEAERDLGEMEKELEQQLSAYRKQRQDEPSQRNLPTGVVSRPPLLDAAVPGEAHASLPVGSADGLKATTAGDNAMSSTARSLSVTSGTPDTANPAALADMPQELLELQAEAALMDEAFPDDPPPDGVEPQRRVRSVRIAARREERKDLRSDPQVVEMKHALDQLDIQLRSIQNREELCNSVANLGEVPDESTGLRVITELRAQNAHIRDCMLRSGSRGLMNLDRSCFGSDVSTTDSVKQFTAA